MSPRHRDIVQSTALLIYAQPALKLRLICIGVVSEELVKNDLVGPGAAHRECIPDDRPLRLPIETEDFSEIVNEAGEDEPPRMPIFPDLLGGLQQVIQLR